MIATVNRQILARILTACLGSGIIFSTAYAETLAPPAEQHKTAQAIVEHLNYGRYREVELHDRLAQQHNSQH